MNDAVPGWRIHGYEPQIEAVKLPDSDDRHVFAAAGAARAQVIVTSSLADFPGERRIG
ncbi:hypothetical protein [Nocardia beijingensis]